MREIKKRSSTDVKKHVNKMKQRWMDVFKLNKSYKCVQ